MLTKRTSLALVLCRLALGCSSEPPAGGVTPDADAGDAPVPSEGGRPDVFAPWDAPPPLESGPFDAEPKPDADPTRDGAPEAETGTTTTTASYLQTTDDIKWGSHGTKLASAERTFYVCRDHFPEGSKVRAEIEKAVGMYNDLGASSAHITVKEKAHRSVAEFFGADPDGDAIEYLDTTASDYPGFPCHKQATDIQCSSWVMNTCTYRPGGWAGAGSGARQFFNISVNANCYKHFANPASSDHPEAHGVAHEMGHGFGMIHTPDWPEKDKGLLSTMQGSLYRLSAYDAAFMRRNYPPTSTTTLENLVASPKMRLPNGNGGWENCHFADFSGNAGMHPEELYPDATTGELRDCATKEAPKFATTWFNRGTVTAAPVELRLQLRATGAATGTYVLRSWTSQQMPAQSQDSWAGSLVVTSSTLGALPLDADYNLEFVVDAGRTSADVDWSDNTVTTKLRVVRSISACKATRKVTSCLDLVR